MSHLGGSPSSSFTTMVGVDQQRDTQSYYDVIANDLIQELEEESQHGVCASPSSASASPSSTRTSSGPFSIEQHSKNIEKTVKRKVLVALCVVFMGSLVSAGFLYVGITTAQKEQHHAFERRANDTAKAIQSVWADYTRTTLWIHKSCRDWRTNGFNRTDFRVLYAYIAKVGLEFYSMEWVPNVTNKERPVLEAEARRYFNSRPDLNGSTYRGFRGLEPDPKDPTNLVWMNRSQEPFYFPIQFNEPYLDGNVYPVHLDLYSSLDERLTIKRALKTYKPALTPRFLLSFQNESDLNRTGYTVVLYNPGPPLPKGLFVEAKDLSNLVIRVRSVLQHAANKSNESMSIYLYDVTDEEELSYAAFLGGAKMLPQEQQSNKRLTFFPEIGYTHLKQQHASSKLFFERNITVGGRGWRIVVVPLANTFKPRLTFVVVAGALIFGAALLLSLWMINNMRRSIQMHRVMNRTAAEAAIVSNLFPPHIRERIIKDAAAKNKPAKKRTNEDDHDDGAFTRDGTNEQGKETPISGDEFYRRLTSETIFGSKPIAEVYSNTTVMVANMIGFSAWSSVREPIQIFQLLETVYHSFDNIAKRRRVFKVETVRDSYVAVAGLPEPRHGHAVVMARFATDCIYRVQKLVKALETSLGPETRDLAMRIGLHSGQVIAGLLRGDKGRFQLFGDTVSMAYEMESTANHNRIQLSWETAQLLTNAGKGKWLIPREDYVHVTGKGQVETFWLNVSSGSTVAPDIVPLNKDRLALVKDARDDYDVLVNWNVSQFAGILRKVVAWRRVAGKRKLMPWNIGQSLRGKPNDQEKKSYFEEVKDVIEFPTITNKIAQQIRDEALLDLQPHIVEDLRHLITEIANMHQNNPFHNFEHASHVTLSVMKMVENLVDIGENQERDENMKFEAEEYKRSVGVPLDPLAEFACAFSALIHDLDHQGIPNNAIIAARSPLALRYRNKCIAEQNALDLAWDLFMSSEYKNLRDCIFGNNDEYTRFRSLVINLVIATNISDEELCKSRRDRWNKAFGGGAVDESSSKLLIDRKTTILVERLIQAADHSHSLQHWNTYTKWNERQFHELYQAFEQGRSGRDPSTDWYRTELDILDSHIIPLAKEIFKDDTHLKHALQNRKEWEHKGPEVVKHYLVNYERKYKAQRNSSEGLRLRS